MIKYKVLQLGDPALLGFAKRKVEELISLGLDDFSKSWVVGETTIRAHCMKMHDAFMTHVVRLWISGVTGGVPIVPLGSYSTTCYVDARNNVVNTGTSITDKYAFNSALLATKKITHVSAYSFLTGADIFVAVAPGFLDFGSTHSDPDFGTVYFLSFTGIVQKQIDFANNLYWYELWPQSNSISFPNPIWGAIDIDKAFNGYTATFDIARQSLRIPDGRQFFAVPMAQGGFTVSIPVEFLNQKIVAAGNGVNNIDQSRGTLVLDSNGNPPNYMKHNDWNLNLINTTITQLDATAAKIQFHYTQKFLGSAVYFVVEEKEFLLPVDSIKHTSNPTYEIVVDPTPSPQGLRYDVSVPDTINDTTYTFYPIANSPSITPEPFAIYLYSKFVRKVNPNGVVVVAGNGSGGIIPCAEGTSEFRETTWYLFDSDGTSTLLDDGALVSTNSPISMPSFNPLVTWYGMNVPEYTYQVQDNDAGIYKGAKWSQQPTALGYEVERSIPSRPDFPPGFELYTIRKPDGTEVWSGYRNRVLPAGGGGYYDTSTSSAIPSGSALSGGVYSAIGTAYAESQGTHNHVVAAFEPFKLYDAPLSVAKEVVVLVSLDMKTKAELSNAIAVLPPGWTGISASTFRGMLSATVTTDFPASFTAITTEFTNARDACTFKDDFNRLLIYTELQKTYDTITTLIDFVARTSTAVGYTDAVSISQYITKIQNDLQALPNVDASFSAYLQALAQTYSNGLNTPLSSSQICKIVAGYLGAYSTYISNALATPWATLLALGPGSFLRVGNL